MKKEEIVCIASAMVFLIIGLCSCGNSSNSSSQRIEVEVTETDDDNWTILGSVGYICVSVDGLTSVVDGTGTIATKRINGRDVYKFFGAERTNPEVFDSKNSLLVSRNKRNYIQIALDWSGYDDNRRMIPVYKNYDVSGYSHCAVKGEYHYFFNAGID